MGKWKESDWSRRAWPHLFPCRETRSAPPESAWRQPLSLLCEAADERPVDLPAVSRHVLELQTRALVRGQARGAASAGADDRGRAAAGAWKKRLVDTNVERLSDRDLAWADVVLLSGMHIQHEALVAIVERCRARGLRTVVGGPIASSLSAAELKADHVVIGEAERSDRRPGAGSGARHGQARLPGRRAAGDGRPARCPT